jgi:hypothetical protein
MLLPPANAVFDYQLGGAYAPAADVRIVDRDRLAPPVPGTYGVCYVNAFQTQPAELARWRRVHPSLLLSRHGRPVVDSAWGERLLDTSTAAKRRGLLRVVGRWIDGCARSGFQAVEPDNLDSYSRSRGALTLSDNKAFATMLIRRAHHDGLAIAQKNTSELRSAGRAMGFDFAVAEECQAYRECGVYMKAYGDEVFEVEYPDNGGVRNFRAACADHGASISITYRDRDVTTPGSKSYINESC